MDAAAAATDDRSPAVNDSQSEDKKSDLSGPPARPQPPVCSYLRCVCGI